MTWQKRDGNTFRTRQLAVWAAVCLCLLLACGRKGVPRPAVEVLPETIRDAAARATAEGIEVSWERPRRYTGGDKMRDLGGFWVQRATGPGAPFETVATIEVTDRERFQQTKRFRWIDAAVKPDETYQYRVVSFTLDRYVSAPSNVAVARNALPGEDDEPAEPASE